MIKGEMSQRILPRKDRINPAWLQRLTQAIERHLRLRGEWTLSVAFVDHRTMRRLNRKYRGHDRVTDILSFKAFPPLKPTPPLKVRGGREGLCDLGELLLAWPYVRAQAKRLGKPLKDELALLIIHGVLHLRGYDHETPRDAAKMISLQEKIFRIYARAQTKR